MRREGSFESRGVIGDRWVLGKVLRGIERLVAKDRRPVRTAINYICRRQGKYCHFLIMFNEFTQYL